MWIPGTVRFPPMSFPEFTPGGRRRRVTKVAPSASMSRVKSSILFNMRRIPANGVGGIRTDPFQAFSFHDPSTTAVPRGSRAIAHWCHPVTSVDQGRRAPHRAHSRTCRVDGPRWLPRTSAFTSQSTSGECTPATISRYRDGLGPHTPMACSEREAPRTTHAREA